MKKSNTKIMRRFGRFVCCVLVFLAFTTVLSGCALTDTLFGGEDTTVPVAPSSQSEVTTAGPEASGTISEITTNTPESTTAPTETGNVGDETTEPAAPKQMYVDPLTGLEFETDYSLVRPVSIVIDNASVAAPQSGISSADIVIECMAEGGISRLILVTNKYVDNYIYGPVRSTRDYMVGLSQAFGCLMVGAGYSPTGYEEITSNALDYIDGTHDSYARSGFFRSADRYTKSGYEHSLMITGNGIRAIASHYNYSIVNQNPWPVFNFVGSGAVNSSGNEAVHTILTYSSVQQIQLMYSKQENAYFRYQYGTKSHYDAENGTQLRFENVLILFSEQHVIPGDEAGRLSVQTTGTGKGYYLTGGKYVEINWARDSFTSAFVFTDAAGNEIELTPGKTFISLMDSSKMGTSAVQLNYKLQ